MLRLQLRLREFLRSRPRLRRVGVRIRQGWRGLVLLYRHVIAIGLRADGDHVFMFAAGIAFNIITSIVPTLLVLLFVLSYVLDADMIIQQLNRYAQTYLIADTARNDVLAAFSDQINTIIANRGLAGLIGFGGLIWSSSALASTIRSTVNTILRCRETRSFYIYKLFDMLAIIGVGLLVYVNIILGPLLELVKASSERIGGELNITDISWVFSEGVSMATTLILFYIIFRFAPYQRQDRIIVWIGTIISAVLWEGARYGFRLYLNEFATLGRVYGTYAFLAGTALWLYISALVFLLGAELAYHVKQSSWFARRKFRRLAASVAGDR